EALADESGDPLMRATALCRRARLALDQNRAAEIAPTLRRALEAALAAGDRALEIEALRLQAVHLRGTGDFEGALAACDRALDRAGLHGAHLAARGAILLQRGIVLRRMGALMEATRAYVEAVVVFRRLGIRRSESLALNALGVALAAIGETEDAVPTIRGSLAIDRETGEQMLLARKLSNVGQLYAELGDVSRALPFFERSQDVLSVIPDPEAEADLLCAMVEVLLEHGETRPRLMKLLDRARSAVDTLRDPYHAARERLVRAQVERATGSIDVAIALAREARRLAAAGSYGYGLQAAVFLAECLAEAGEIAEPKKIVEGVQQDVLDRDVERAERVHASLARTLRALGDRDGAARAQAIATDIVHHRFEGIRDPALREHYRTLQNRMGIPL
ncbi:MAG: tetratricopeptide repeat protein, partial [Myxococcales bacterium]|nr:tetratricopeptide repeat protein [Myxococcales bacterium]